MRVFSKEHRQGQLGQGVGSRFGQNTPKGNTLMFAD
jgi:hypothetical protein